MRKLWQATWQLLSRTAQGDAGSWTQAQGSDWAALPGKGSSYVHRLS
jgi:hypothetical protein